MKRDGTFAFAPGFAAEPSFLAVAERINDIFREAAVAPHGRAPVLAALLLAWPQSVSSPRKLIALINRRLAVLAGEHGQLLKHLRIALPRTASGREKLIRALFAVHEELARVDADGFLNSGDDRLGRFYEVFLKYGGWARDLGIVLTPPRLARFAARVLAVGPGDRVYDPTCGTGGFLTAALEEMNSGASRMRSGVFGLEQETSVASLALANMLLRGENPESVTQGDCFAEHDLARAGAGEYTKVMMNPPFSVKGRPEFRFVEKALENLREDGLLFAVLPYSVLVRPGLYKARRRDLFLRDNTLLAVITLPEEMFHPVGVPAAAVIIRKGRARANPDHAPKVLWARANSDGLRISRGRRLPSSRASNELGELGEIIRAFIHEPAANIANKRRVLHMASPDIEDPLLELVPEAYLRDGRPAAADIMREANVCVRESLACMVKAGKAIFSADITRPKRPGRAAAKTKWKTFRAEEILEIAPGDFHSLGHLEPGPWPVVSRASVDNGLAGYFEKPNSAVVREPGTLTVSTVTGDAFAQFMPYLATDNVLVCRPRDAAPPAVLYFLQLMINRNRWRYSYGRQCYLAKFRRMRISLPVTERGRLNHAWMSRIIASAEYWPPARLVMEKAVAEQGSVQ